MIEGYQDRSVVERGRTLGQNGGYAAQAKIHKLRAKMEAMLRRGAKGFTEALPSAPPTSVGLSLKGEDEDEQGVGLGDFCDCFGDEFYRLGLSTESSGGGK